MRPLFHIPIKSKNKAPCKKLSLAYLYVSLSIHTRTVHVHKVKSLRKELFLFLWLSYSVCNYSTSLFTYFYLHFNCFLFMALLQPSIFELAAMPTSNSLKYSPRVSTLQAYMFLIIGTNISSLSNHFLIISNFLEFKNIIVCSHFFFFQYYVENNSLSHLKQIIWMGPSMISCQKIMEHNSESRSFISAIKYNLSSTSLYIYQIVSM